jgi:radical SAM protein with 4Fe4S-binding SPASM domain
MNRDPSGAEIQRQILSLRSSGDLGPEVRPLNLEMDVTNQCNLRCVMCYFADDTVHMRKRSDMTVAQFERVAAQIFPFAHRVSLSVGTEPLLNPHFADFVTITQRYAVPCVYINTNGLLLTGRLVEHMIQCGFSAVSISMDGATPATYERIRAGSRFDRVIGNIRMVNRLKRLHASATPELAMLFVMMRSNIRELPDFIDLAHELEVPHVNAIHLVPYTDLNIAGESLVHDKQLCNRMLDEARERAARHAIVFREPGNFSDARLPTTVDRAGSSIARGHELNLSESERESTCCPFPWHFVAIDANGDVRPCGWWHNEPAVGNIWRQTFDEIWSGDGYRRIRSEHLVGELRSVCRTCPAAGLGSVNDERAFAARAW